MKIEHTKDYPASLSHCFVENEHDITLLFTYTQEGILNLISEIENYSERKNCSFEEVFPLYDEIGRLWSQAEGTLSAYTLVGPDACIRDAARKALAELERWWLENVMNSENLYHILKTCFENNKNFLSVEEKLFAKDALQDFVDAGMALDSEKRKMFITLKSELAHLLLEFEAQIAASASERGIWVLPLELEGLTQEFCERLKKREDGRCFIGVDYPTYDYVMKECKNAVVRDALLHEFTNRAYPENEKVLMRMRELRSEIAALLGYANYAEYDLRRTMAGNSKAVYELCLQVVDVTKSLALEQKELLHSLARESQYVLEKGKLSHADIPFLTNLYLKEKYEVDHEKIAEYFPVQSTIDSLFRIYGDFFNIDFYKREEQEKWWWDDTLEVIDIYDRSTKKHLGTIIFDLYPRSGKFSHACHLTLRSAQKKKEDIQPSLALVIANFPAPTKERDGLLRFNDVTTFFHECGHALHGIFGATRFVYHAGTRVPIDFVEVPSQMYELWMEDVATVQAVSKHYKTGDPLPEVLIRNLVASEKTFEALGMHRQILFSLLSLEIYSSLKDLETLRKECASYVVQTLSKRPDDHMECSFGHLTDYAAKYYSYLWSFVYSLDLFECIKERGLGNLQVGREFREKVLAPGGSRPALESMKDFLGREPSFEAIRTYLQR